MKQRNSNIELLRILAMFMIVSGHFIGQSGIAKCNQSLDEFGLIFFGSGMRIAVNVF